MKAKEVLIFGSTGSVGKNALDIIKKNKKLFQIKGLCANRNFGLLLEQVKVFKPKYVCLGDLSAAEKLETKLGKGVKLLKGKEGLDEFAKLKSDISVMAISGISCLRPLLANIEHSKRIALANKEAVVAAAKFIFKKAKKFKTEIIPVDSEINALFQLLKMAKAEKKNIDKVYITASGGALLDYSRESLKNVSIEKVLSHPTWSMGQRITVDSATLINKAFEVVEVNAFFGIDYDKIGILLHRQSMVHAMVRLGDQSLFSCIYEPDMKKPIAAALFYPGRMSEALEKKGEPKGDFSYQILPDKKFFLLEAAIEVAKRKDNGLIILNAADEVVVDYFLCGKVKFIEIEKTLKKIMEIYPPAKVKSVKDIYFWNKWGKDKAKEILKKNKNFVTGESYGSSSI